MTSKSLHKKRDCGILKRKNRRIYDWRAFKGSSGRVVHAKRVTVTFGLSQLMRTRAPGYLRHHWDRDCKWVAIAMKWKQNQACCYCLKKHN
jgi:hypothetical protein